MTDNCKSLSSRLATDVKSIAKKRAGFTIEEIFQRQKINRWFLVQIKEIVDFEEELATTRN